MSLAYRNIVLIGFMGTGKTTVGKIIAQRLGFSFIDIDQEIKDYYSMSIGEIFSTYGEKHFREIESENVIRYSMKKSCVISTGGGVVLNSKNIENLKRNGIIIRLNASVETILRNVMGDTVKIDDRPLLKSDNVQEKIRQLMNAREELYSNSCNYEIFVDALTPCQVADNVVNLLALERLLNKAAV